MVTLIIDNSLGRLKIALRQPQDVVVKGSLRRTSSRGCFPSLKLWFNVGKALRLHLIPHEFYLELSGTKKQIQVVLLVKENIMNEFVTFRITYTFLFFPFNWIFFN